RYAQLVKERGGTVLAECPRTLAGVLAKCPGIDRLVTRGDDLPPFDVQVPLLSLPRIFKTTVETIPAGVPYLFADPGLVSFWRGRLAGIHAPATGSENPPKTIQIGVNWAGRATPGPHKQRDIPIERFAAPASVPGVQLVSLQKGNDNP